MRLAGNLIAHCPIPTITACKNLSVLDINARKIIDVPKCLISSAFWITRKSVAGLVLTVY
jgi:hypothetical protein